MKYLKTPLVSKIPLAECTSPVQSLSYVLFVKDKKEKRLCERFKNKLPPRSPEYVFTRHLRI